MFDVMMAFEVSGTYVEIKSEALLRKVCTIKSRLKTFYGIEYK